MGREVGLFSALDKINPTQRKVLEDRKRAICVQGGLGSGKSLLSQMDILVTALDNPGCDLLYLRKTFEQIADSVIADMENNFVYNKLFPEAVLYGGSWDKAFFKNDRRPYLLINVPGPKPSRIHFRGAMHDGREDPSRFGSMPYLGAYFEEYSDFDNPKVFNYIDGRCRQQVPLPNGKKSYNRLLLVGNPPMDSHWSQKEFIRLPAERPEVAALRSFYKLPTEENRTNLPSGYIENMLASYSESWIARYLRGEAGIIEEGQPVLEGFYMASSRDGRPWHVGEDRIPHNPIYPVIRAWDFGVAYMSCVWMQYAPEPYPHVLVLHEITGRNTNAFAFGHLVRPISQTMFPGAMFIDVGDPTGVNRSPADGRSSFSVLADKHNISIMPAPTNNVLERINTMVEMFSRNSRPGVPFVQISHAIGTETLRDGLEAGWAYKRESGGFIKPHAEPLKNQYSHGADALGYGMCYINAYKDAIEPVRGDHAGGRKGMDVQIITQPESWMSV